MTPRQRYAAAHRAYQEVEYPNLIKDGHYTEPVYPNVATANGMQTWILNFLKWNGWRCTRINVSGRLLQIKSARGVATNDKWIKSSTRKGSADLSCTILGRSLMIEIKAGNDTASDHQLTEQQRERKAGGAYEFVHSVEEFLDIYDAFIAKYSLS